MPYNRHYFYAVFINNGMEHFVQESNSHFFFNKIYRTINRVCVAQPQSKHVSK